MDENGNFHFTHEPVTPDEGAALDFYPVSFFSLLNDSLGTLGMQGVLRLWCGSAATPSWSVFPAGNVPWEKQEW